MRFPGFNLCFNLQTVLPAVVGSCAVLLALNACGTDYSAITNRLREQTIKQDTEISDLKGKVAERDATIRQLQGQLDERLPRVQTLPDDRLVQLFTAARIEIRPQTDSWEFEGGKGLAGFRFFLRTFADDGTNIPATGALTLEAFEISPAPAAPKRLGTWTFTAADMKKSWYGGMGLNQFALSCPWNAPPKTADVLFKATFLDGLTGKSLEAHLNKKVSLPQ